MDNGPGTWDSVDSGQWTVWTSDMVQMLIALISQVRRKHATISETSGDGAAQEETRLRFRHIAQFLFDFLPVVVAAVVAVS